MKTIQKNTIFTNVGETNDGGVYWEGIDKQLAPGETLTSWKKKEWTPENGNHSCFGMLTTIALLPICLLVCLFITFLLCLSRDFYIKASYNKN